MNDTYTRDSDGKKFEHYDDWYKKPIIRPISESKQDKLTYLKDKLSNNSDNYAYCNDLVDLINAIEERLSNEDDPFKRYKGGVANL